MKILLNTLISDDEAATAVEYGLLAALLCLAALGAFEAFGQGLGEMWGEVRNEATNAMG
ncbi:MAG: Flp family type IVb pilin [Pacificimonas sp.]|nr:Flp family type IVb pilin [Pacificimonas sp.]